MIPPRQDYQWAPERGFGDKLRDLILFIMFLPLIIGQCIYNKVKYEWETFNTPSVMVVYENGDNSDGYTWEEIGERCRGHYDELVVGSVYKVNESLRWSAGEPKPKYILLTTDNKPFPIYEVFTGDEKTCSEKFDDWVAQFGPRQTGFMRIRPDWYFLEWSTVQREKMDGFNRILDWQEVSEPLHTSFVDWPS